MRLIAFLGRFRIEWNHSLRKNRPLFKGAGILIAPLAARYALGRFRIEWDHSLRRNRPLFKGAGILLAPLAARYALAVVLMLAVPQLAAAQTTIVAVVNGEPITSYDLRQREALMRLTGVRGNVRQQALDELIDDAVRNTEAERYQVSASEGQVNAAIAEIAKRVKLSPAQLGQALGQSGVNIQTLRDRLRAQIAFNSLTRARFRRSGMVSEQELVAALLKDDERENTIDTTLYELEQITIALPDDPSQARLNRANKRAEDLRRRFTSCRDGVPMARKTRNVVVKPFGNRLEPELTREARAALEGVAVGRLSKPIRVPRGLVMFAVCDKSTQRSTNAAMKELEPSMEEERGRQFSQQYLRQLRRDAVIERR